MKIVVLTIIVIMFAGLEQVVTLTCPKCNRHNCTLISSCPGNVTKDNCGCCDVCARVELESCGGTFGQQGTCDQGLKCVLPERAHPKTFIGTCVPNLTGPDSTQVQSSLSDEGDADSKITKRSVVIETKPLAHTWKKKSGTIKKLMGGRSLPLKNSKRRRLFGEKYHSLLTT